MLEKHSPIFYSPDISSGSSSQNPTELTNRDLFELRMGMNRKIALAQIVQEGRPGRLFDWDSGLSLSKRDQFFSLVKEGAIRRFQLSQSPRKIEELTPAELLLKESGDPQDPNSVVELYLYMLSPRFEAKTRLAIEIKLHRDHIFSQASVISPEAAGVAKLYVLDEEIRVILKLRRDKKLIQKITEDLKNIDPKQPTDEESQRFLQELFPIEDFPELKKPDLPEKQDDSPTPH